MKVMLKLICFLIVSIARTQEFDFKEIAPPTSEKLDDLSFLKDELIGKHLVMLGEQTHMYGSMFLMKIRVIKYLHQEMGFNTIAMESSMYDIWKTSNKNFDANDFNKSIWNVWSKTLEFQSLVDYIDNNNIIVVGFDSQVNNASQFVEDFFTYCEAQNIRIELDKTDLGIIIEGVLDNVTYEDDDIKFEIYEKEILRIISEIQHLESSDLNYYWGQFVKGLLSCSQDAYYNTEEILTSDFANKNYNIRDKQMSDNLLTYLKRNPREKIIVWADNIHIINDISSVSKAVIKDFRPMGSYLKKELNDRSYSLAMIHANDSLYDLGRKQWYETPIDSCSFEFKLKRYGKPYLFLKSSQDRMQSPQLTRLLNFIEFTEVNLSQLYNGYIFFIDTSLPQENLDITAKVKRLEMRLKESVSPLQIENKSKKVHKGRILDVETKLPIPFTTIFINDEQIYRVANENGIYELPTRQANMGNAMVTISSLGYESITIPFIRLKKDIYLNPRYEELEEVVVTGHLTPTSVLKKAIDNKRINYPTTPFNFSRYGKINVSIDDLNELNLEVITRDYDDGYLSPYVITQRVEQIKWNSNNNSKKYLHSSQFFSFRQNAIRFSNILHKRKFKKFKLRFVKSLHAEQNDIYIIEFQSNRNKWNYTNRGYPTNYSGRIFINKEDFAVVKVIENWETTLDKSEIQKYYKGYQEYQDALETTIKEENICVYKQLDDKNKYFATYYSNRRYSETTNQGSDKSYKAFEVDSYPFDFEFDNIENIQFEWRLKEETSLYRVDFDKAFWHSFYKKNQNVVDQFR